MSSIEVMVPTKPARVPVPAALAPRDALPEHPHLTLISNGKPKAREFLELLAEELGESLAFGEVELVAKPGASLTIPPAEAEQIAARSDLVIAALGDCGACSACSLHDAVQFERLGVPSTVIITDVFTRSVANFARSLGMPGYHTVVLPHPVSSRDMDRLRRMAADAAPVARDQLAARVPALSA
jgi:hypothetical protein